jgi:hypothetical protein
MVPMPEHTLLALMNYWKTHRRERLIFPGTQSKTNTPMDKGSVQKALKRVLQNCQIKNSLAPIRFVIALLRICLNKGLICALCSNYLDTPVSTPLHATQLTKVKQRDMSRAVNDLTDKFILHGL